MAKISNIILLTPYESMVRYSASQTCVLRVYFILVLILY